VDRMMTALHIVATDAMRDLDELLPVDASWRTWFADLRERGEGPIRDLVYLSIRRFLKDLESGVGPEAVRSWHIATQRMLFDDETSKA